jgi:uncharacterized OsmC-like protein
MTTTVPAPVDNGVDAAALHAARDALTAAPEAAAFVWKATSEWVRGTHTRSAVETFHGLGDEQGRAAAHVVETDHPTQFSAADRGMTPVEMVLCGLAGCLTAGVASVAQHRGIQLHSVTATVEADMDMRGILGIDADVRNGFGHVRASFVVDADASPEDVRRLVAQSQKRSAVFDVIANQTVVTVEVAS